MRDAAQAALGERFRYSDFHDQVLRHGSLPLTVFQDEMKAWIVSQSV